jgi:hypothetical protein
LLSTLCKTLFIKSTALSLGLPLPIKIAISSAFITQIGRPVLMKFLSGAIRSIPIFDGDFF